MGITNQDRQLVSLQIVDDFISRITGCNQDRVVGDIPDNVYYVGKLMSTEDEDNKFGSSRTFIDSIGLDFIINETEFKNAHIDVFPKGDLYYRAVPTLDEQRAYYIDEFKKTNADLKVESFEELVEIREHEPERFNQVSAKLVPVYKKVSLNNNNFSIGLLVSDFILKGGICESILQHQYLSIAGLVICVLFVVLGERNKKHRGRTHSLLALLLSSAGIFLIHPYIGISYAIGFASHIACDLLNKSKVQVLYPLDKTGICFNFCYAERLINQILCGVGLTIIFIYVYIMKFV